MQTIGVQNAIFKSFSTFEEAIGFLNIKQETKTPLNKSTQEGVAVAYVDGSYNATTKTYGFGAVLMFNNNEYEFMGSGNDAEMTTMRNVSGEILGSQKAITEAINLGFDIKSIGVM